jgi:chromosomal replication initiator protein
LHGTASQLIGALYELFAEVPKGTPADSNHARRFLAARDARCPNLNEIVAIVARHYGVPQKLLRSHSRRQSAVQARAAVVYLARELTELSYAQIGRALGGRDHTTIMHSYRKIEGDCQQHLAMQQMLDDLCRILLNY